MWPRFYLLLGAALAAVVLIAELTASDGTCAQGSPDPGDWVWVRAVILILGPLSIVSIFASIFVSGRRHEAARQNTLGLIVLATLGAGIWGAVGFFLVFWIALGKSGCLS